MSENTLPPEHHDKRNRFLALFKRVEAHHDGSQPLDEDEFERLLADRQEAWEDYAAISSRRFG